MLIMNWDVISAVGESVGAIGVIGSLIYLALQVRKSDQTVRAERIQALWDGSRDRLLAPGSIDPQLSDLVAKGLTSFEALDNSDKRRFYWFFFEQCFQAQQAMDLYKASLIPLIDYNAWMHFAGTLMQTPGGKQIWPYIENTITPNTKDELVEWLSKNPETQSFIELNPFFCEPVESTQ